MNIVFVDDNPEFKVQPAIDFLKTKIKFNFKILESKNDALNFIANNMGRIDVIVMDLGLPYFTNCYDSYEKIAGLGIITEILRRFPITDMPIIFNSETEIDFGDGESEEEHFKKMFPNVVIKHVPLLEGEWFYDFLKKNKAYQIKKV